MSSPVRRLCGFGRARLRFRGLVKAAVLQHRERFLMFPAKNASGFVFFFSLFG
jgi:hypothetical protein